MGADEKDGLRWIGFPEESVEVCGFPWFEETSPRLWRFPDRMQNKMPTDVFEAGKQTAGGRLRLRSDTGALSVRARFPALSIRTNMTQYTAHGISTYVNGECWSAKIPGTEGGEVTLSLFSGTPSEFRDICIYLPLYGPVEILEIGLDEGASFESPSSFRLDRPVVYYGTSITQGGCASRPGLSYQGMVGRALNLDYANFGFSGKGKCEREVAEALAEIDACCFVLDVGQNTSVEELDERFVPFLDTLRDRRPEIPVLATTPIFYNAELWSTGHQAGVNAKRSIISEAVANRNDGGDDLAYLLEAKDYLWRDFTDGAVDGGHPNDLGFARMAENLGPVLAGVLGL
jgi:lysophospholipase L1-like esterase